MTPYAAFLLPQQLGGSGVLATVAAGLFVSWNGPLLIPAATRLQGIFFWDLVVYLLEGFVFLVTGMQVRTVFLQMHEVPWHHFAYAIVLTVAVVIATRFVWVYPAALVAALAHSVAGAPRSGAAVALAVLPGLCRRARRRLAGGGLGYSAVHRGGAPFPDRDLILFVTFGVIVVTLIGQGLAAAGAGALARA